METAKALTMSPRSVYLPWVSEMRRDAQENEEKGVINTRPETRLP